MIRTSRLSFTTVYNMVFLTCLGLLFSLSCKPAATPLETKPSKGLSVPSDTFGINYIMGKFDPANHPDFVEIPAKYRDEKVRYIRKEVMAKFADMADAAAKEGIRLLIRSATRNFEDQKRIWENKWNGNTPLEDGRKANAIEDEFLRAKSILLYSSMPGTSRHHWGTDVDINAFENSWFESGAGAKLYAWMQKNAAKYGFCQVYGPIDAHRKYGYEQEKWHWSYLPIANTIQQEVVQKMKNEMITGFAGSHKATTIDMVKVYMLSIDPACK